MLQPFPSAAYEVVISLRPLEVVMKNVTIRRCPVCSSIGSHTDRLAADLRNDPNMRVNVVDGSKGEFTVEVDGRRINAKNGDSLRDASELAAEIRGAQVATAG